MATLVHITAESQARRIRRNGIGVSAYYRAPAGFALRQRGVYSFPVLARYTLTHSWARELKRCGRTSLAAVTFLVDDTELVFVSHFGSQALAVSAAEAVGIVRAEADPRGFEIVVPRRILPSEIRRVAVLPKAIGWRYWPEAKGRPLRLCDCPMCVPRGEVKARRYRDRVQRAMAADAGGAASD